jgi:hypothetical protein
VSGPVDDRCWGLSKVKIWWGRWLPSWFVDGSCSNQHVPPRVQYGTTCLLIRELWVCILFESNREGYGYTLDPPGARGARDRGSLAESPFMSSRGG